MSSTDPSTFSGRVLIIGGRGALGSVLIDHFQKLGYWVISVDRAENTLANCNICLKVKVELELEQQVNLIQEELEKYPGLKFDGILCVAGGWTGGNVKDPNFLGNVDLMWRQSVGSSLVGVYLARLYLKEGGLLLLTGAEAALNPTPCMIAYGMAKGAVHNLVRSLGEKDAGQPEGSKVLAILPVTLDTPNNRKAMPNADFGTWTSLKSIARLLQEWIENVKEAPKSGSLAVLRTTDGNTVTEIK